jgi:hypothetical protein
MNRCYALSRRRFIRCPPRHLVVEDQVTQLLWRYTPTVHQIIWCWRTPRQNLTIRIFESVGWTAAVPLVHPVLKLQSWRVSVLIQTERRIDRLCPHLDRRIIRCYCLHSSSSAIHLAHLETGPSDHPMVSSSFCLLHSVPSALTLAPMVPLVHPTVSFSFLFSASSTWIFAST